jgi:hypothetical protein
MDVGLDQGAVMLFGARLCFVCILGIGRGIVTGVIGFIVLVRIGNVCHLFADVAGFLVCFVPAVLLFVGVGSFWGCVSLVFWLCVYSICLRAWFGRCS